MLSATVRRCFYWFEHNRSGNRNENFINFRRMIDAMIYMNAAKECYNFTKIVCVNTKRIKHSTLSFAGDIFRIFLILLTLANVSFQMRYAALSLFYGTIILKLAGVFSTVDANLRIHKFIWAMLCLLPIHTHRMKWKAPIPMGYRELTFPFGCQK